MHACLTDEHWRRACSPLQTLVSTEFLSLPALGKQGCWVQNLRSGIFGSSKISVCSRARRHLQRQVGNPFWPPGGNTRQEVAGPGEGGGAEGKQDDFALDLTPPSSGPAPSFPDWALLGERCHTGANYEGVRDPCQVTGLALTPRGALYSSGHLLPFASLTLTLIIHCKEVSRVGYEGPLSLCPWALLACRTLWPPTTGRKRLA